MILECPLCHAAVNSKEIQLSQGGFYCPHCQGGLTYSLRHPILRRTAALIGSGLILAGFGVRSILFLFLGSILLWPFVQIIANVFHAYVTSPGLKPWTPGTRRSLWKSEPAQVFEWKADQPAETNSKPDAQKD